MGRSTAAAVVALLLAAACRGSAGPADAYRAFSAAARSGDSEAVWRMLSDGSRKTLEARARALAGRAPAGVLSGSGKDLVLGDGAAATARPTSIVVLRESRDAAVLAVQVEGGERPREVSLVREEGVWRVAVPFDN